ncbi:uncharacterized protein LOC128315112 isoform X5 [Acinonyx jubatus]|uniref:Uncharacterized protein LOC128315112 isoform X5 n=1 Tax=Acinonyx jubatus TaxID=32536 RepID=A0ABM3PXZ3_ACIJB|nr:uncharacterized protein LOC128315112 isoform X5 [Acinonyx jubatus]
MGGGGRGAMEQEGSEGELGRRRLGPCPGALSCPPWPFPLPGDAAPGARDVSRAAAAPRSTCDRAAFVYGGPAFGRSTRQPRPWEGGGRGEGPRRGRGRRISPPDPAAAPESQARLRVAASRDSPRRGPRAPGLEEVAEQIPVSGSACGGVRAAASGEVTQYPSAGRRPASLPWISRLTAQLSSWGFPEKGLRERPAW